MAGSPLYVVHVSCKESVEPIALAREKGWDVWGETCTQYFFIDYEYLEKPNFEGAKYVYTPPPSDKANQEALWNAVRTDVLSAVSTDHCAFRWDSQKTLGKDDFVVFDPEKKLTLSASTHHSKVDYNLFEGTTVTGSPEVVLLRGNVLVENDELVASPGIGQFVRRARFGEELKPARAAVTS